MIESAPQPSGSNPRNPWVAAGLSLLLPGLGHLYAGRRWLALFVLAGTVVSMVVAVVAILWAPQPLNVLALWTLTLGTLVVVAISAAATARRSNRTRDFSPNDQWYLYFAIWLPFALVAGLLIAPWMRNNVGQAFRIPSGSMEPSILIGDLIYVRSIHSIHGISPGTVVVFQSMEENIKVIKRVVGIPGDTLAMKGGQLSRNGELERANFIQPGKGRSEEDDLQRARMRTWQLRYLVSPDSSYRPDLEDWGPLVVPADSYFVLGDNRDASYDSRYFGFIPAASIQGVPIVIYYSYDHESSGFLPFLTAIRWKRMGLRLEHPLLQPSVARSADSLDQSIKGR